MDYKLYDNPNFVEDSSPKVNAESKPLNYLGKTDEEFFGFELPEDKRAFIKTLLYQRDKFMKERPR